MNAITHEELGDPETLTRIRQYEMAFRMQASVPELTDINQEPEHIFKLYGEEARKPGSFANTTLMARRLAERGVRFIQVYHNNWDHHSNVGGRMPDQCQDVDQPCHALITDLKERGMFDDTLIIWGGEFGRTPMGQGDGRDHHIKGFSYIMAGAGIPGGQKHGATDELGYAAVDGVVHVRDLHATMLHLMGIDHAQLRYEFRGLDLRLAGVEPARVLHDVIG